MDKRREQIARKIWEEKKVTANTWLDYLFICICVIEVI